MNPGESLRRKLCDPALACIGWMDLFDRSDLNIFGNSLREPRKHFKFRIG